MATDQIRVDGPDGAAVYIRAKRPGYGLRNKILSTAAQACAVDGGVARVPDVWAMQNATLHHSIVAWEGAALPPCKPGQRFPMEALDDLDEEFGKAILAKIDEIGKVDDPDPNDEAPGGNG